MRRRPLTAVMRALVALSAASAHATDLSSPRGAAAAFDDAYDAHDIEGLVARQDFVFEARESLVRFGETAPDAATLQRAAKGIENEYRDRMQKLGFPERNRRGCRYLAMTQEKDDRVSVLETCPSPTGQGTIFDGYLLVQRDGVWRIALPAPPMKAP